MSTPVSASLIGLVIDGRYKVLEHIADGGMGSVYVALDGRLDRDVALKVMRPDLARDEDFVRRFRREATSAARLSHPNVVAVTDQGRDAHYVFLAMELVRGHTLREVIDSSGPLPVDRALEIADAYLQALSAAHRAGIVHRDVKPENVLIGQDGSVKVADFGLARAVTTATMTSDSDVLLGTAAYLSPEQVEHGKADERSDVYSAALLLFEMLTGRKAFPGDSPINVAYQHVHGEPPSLAAQFPYAPASLEELVTWGSARDPQDRPTDAADYLAQLRRVRAHLSLAQLALSASPSTSATTAQPVGTPDTGHTSVIAADSTRSITRPDQPPAPARTGRRRGRLSALLGALALAAAAIWTFTAGPLGQTTMPSVAGSAQGKAVAAVSKADLSSTIQEVFSETVPRGDVVQSNPAGGTGIRKHSSVTLQVSKGPERYNVPQVGGQPLAGAQSAIQNAHLRVGQVSHEFSDSVAKDHVIRAAPDPGTQVKKDSPVDLVVSDGRQPIAIPDVTGKPKAAAESALTAAGFTVKYASDAFNYTVAKGSIATENPAGGGNGFKGDTITLTVSKGPQTVTVPDTVGDSSGDARKQLEALGLNVKIETYFGGFFDRVRAQSVNAGQQVPNGTTITLSVV